MTKKIKAIEINEKTAQLLQAVLKTNVFELPRQEVYLDKSPFVYFLFDDGILVYIGKTTDIAQRLHFHLKSGKIFDSYSVQKYFDRESTEIAERFFINRFLPKYNNDAYTQKLKNQ
jgi:hypothetical protein